MKFLLLLFVVILLSTIANAQIHPIVYTNDGPYVFYSKDSATVNNIIRESNESRVITRAYKLPLQAKVNLQVNFSAHKNWNFSFPLQSQLQVQPAEYEEPEKIAVFSDLEGEFQGLRRLLIANKIMDLSSKWIFGKGHLVICGDLFDRGLNVTETLWLFYKLEQEALAQGGYVHIILGNHDIMNLSGDTRYVQPKYITNAAFFNLGYPALFNADTELGKWLRTKNIVEKIGRFLFMHAGISPQVNAMQLDVSELNETTRPYYDKSEQWGRSQALITLYSAETSPFWYRGYFLEPKATEAQIDETLNFLKVEKIIVGHTILKTNVGFYYNRKVIGLDVDHHAFTHEGVLFEKGMWYKIDTSGKKKPLEKH